MSVVIFAASIGALTVAAQAAPPAMQVSEAQFAEALAMCRAQLARPAFVEDELVKAGWRKVASQASDGKAGAMATYRHPANMLLFTLVDEPAKPDTCSVMAPIGAGALDGRQATAAVSAIAGGKPKRVGSRDTWTTDFADIVAAPMGNVGVRATMTGKPR